ncbi:hypothetical protein [Buttiauxella sp. S04-F03]|uniref:hypothetical protein n=1 Tax=Buttiauxella sp. S04-F03 TaxID=2904525 RepID=UPI0012AE2E46|nr:hypothetical protein [Buttiauxella sp. S04-F03]MCE0815000.1 hypothetical protein [Buttiauxella sp. S04-F03]MRT15165.1 hypothetical protein [Enterobacteriaceae bacterium RIT711]
MSTLSKNPAASQARRIAVNAYSRREREPVAAFHQWELAANLLRLAHMAAGTASQ